MTNTDDLEIKTDTIGKVVVIRVVGKLHIDNSAQFHAIREQELSKGAKRFIIDLTQCTWIDSDGIGQVVLLQRDVELIGGKLKWLPSPKIRDLLSYMCFTQVLLVYDNEEQALGNFDDVRD